MNSHEFLVIDDEGLGQGDIGGLGKDLTAVFVDDPDEQNSTIPFGLQAKGAEEAFALLAYRLGPSGEDPSRPVIKRGSTILSATLRVNSAVTNSDNVDCRLAVMKQDDKFNVEDITEGGNFQWAPVLHCELDSNGGTLAHDGGATIASSNQFFRREGSTPGYGRRGIGTSFNADATGTLNRILISYDTFPADVGAEVFVEVYSSGGLVAEKGTLLATSDPHTSLPSVTAGFEANSRAFTFSGSDRITLDSGTKYYAVMRTADATGSVSPRVFFRTGAVGFLEAGYTDGIGNGFGSPGYNHDADFESLWLTDEGTDTLNANHIGTPVTFLNIGNWTAGVDFDFTGLEAMVQAYIDDASYSAGDPLCLCIDPIADDGGDDVLRSFVSMSNDGVGAKLIIEWLDPDETAPLVTIDDPNDLDILSGTTTINITATDPQGSMEVSPEGVAIVRAILNPGNNLIGTDLTPVGDVYSIAFDTTLFADGVYTLRAEADDAASPLNTGFDEITITIDNLPDFPAITESQLSLSGLSSVSDRTQAANLRVTEPSVAKPRGGSQIIVKKET